jgi:antitoxin ParD1/3/4
MTRIISISIEPQLDKFISELIDSGWYTSISDVIRASLYLLEQHENNENSGESELSLQDIVAAVKQKHSA